MALNQLSTDHYQCLLTKPRKKIYNTFSYTSFIKNVTKLMISDLKFPVLVLVVLVVRMAGCDFNVIVAPKPCGISDLSLEASQKSAFVIIITYALYQANYNYQCISWMHLSWYWWSDSPSVYSQDVLYSTQGQGRAAVHLAIRACFPVHLHHTDDNSCRRRVPIVDSVARCWRAAGSWLCDHCCPVLAAHMPVCRRLHTHDLCAETRWYATVRAM